MPRAERRIRTIGGMGGRLQIYHFKGVEYSPGAPTVPIYMPGPSGILDISRWQVRHKQVTADITHSGSYGALKRACVARDFSFACSCPWNSRDVLSEQGVLPGFLEQILTGFASADYNIGIEFFLGDPLSYIDPVSGTAAPAAYLKAPEAVLDESLTICDATGKDVIRIDFSGSGNSLLQGYRQLPGQAPELKFPLADTQRPLYNT